MTDDKSIVMGALQWGVNANREVEAAAALVRLAAQAARARSMEELADGYAFEAQHERKRADRYEAVLREYTKLPWLGEGAQAALDAETPDA